MTASCETLSGLAWIITKFYFFFLFLVCMYGSLIYNYLILIVLSIN